MKRWNRAAGIAVMVAVGAFFGCQGGGLEIHPAALVASQSVPVNQVEDAAIWIHPTDRAKSMLLVANKTRGLALHDFDGYLQKHYDDGKPLAGLDVLYDVPDGKGKVDLVIGACPAESNGGVRVWRIDPAKDRVTEATAGGIIKVLDGADPLGIVGYHSRKDGGCYFFVTTEEGKIEQYRLAADANGNFGATRVRQFSLTAKVKAGVADEEAGAVYFANEKVGVYQFDAEPGGGEKGELILKVGDHGLVADWPGITLYSGREGKGYLIVVSQSPKGKQSTLGIFERQAPHRYVGTIAPKVGELGGIFSSSGIAVTNRATSSVFPQGVLAVKNRINPSGVEDYKLYSWKEIARSLGLMTDTQWSPR